MGTQPEDIERALRGRRTLPTPGEPQELGEGRAAGTQGRKGAGGKTGGEGTAKR